MMKKILASIGLSLSVLMTGCATNSVPKDVTAYKHNMPKSILVLPPINNTPDVNATYGYWSTVNVPLAEAGYYTYPISLVDRMFKENGVSDGFDAQSLPPEKLKEIFGADAGLYIRIKEYGTKYQVLQSMTVVSADAKLVDFATGQVLWSGDKQLAQSSNDNQNAGLVGALVSALVQQIGSNYKDYAHPLSIQMNNQLFTPNDRQVGSGLLYGPRSSHFQKDGLTQQ